MSILSKITDTLFGWLAPKPEKQKKEGKELTKAATDAYIPKIYGSVKKQDGILIYRASNDSDPNDKIKNELMHLIIVWAEAVESIDRVYIDDLDIALDNPMYVIDGRRLAYAVNFPNGMENYSDPDLTASGWRSTDTVSGKACTYIRLQFSHGENGLDSDLKYTADLTGTLSQTPSDHILDLLQSNIYGKGENASRLGLAAFSATTTTCKTQVETAVGSGEYRDLFTCNIALDTGESVFDNLNTLLKSMRGFMPILNGKLTPIIEKDDPVVSLEILEADIIEMSPIKNSSKRNRFNRVVVTYFNDDENSSKQEAVYPEKNSQIEADWLADDNGVLLEKSIDLDTCRDYYEALAFAKALAQVSREQLSTNVTLPLWATLFEVGDIVNFTHSKFGETAKPFRITNTSESDVQVELSLREHQPYIYDFNNTGLKPSFPDSSNIITGPTPPSALTVLDFYTSLKQVSITWLGSAVDYQIKLIDSNGEIIITDRVTRKQYDLRNLDQGVYTFSIRSLSTAGIPSVSVTTTVTIDKSLASYTWRAWADDEDGLNASKTDDTKDYIGHAYGRDTATFDITDPNIIAQFGFIQKPADGAGTPGASGKSFYNAILFASGTAKPSKPLNNSGSFNFDTGVLTPPSGWSESIPDNSLQKWVTRTAFAIVGNTGIDTTSTYTDVVAFVKDGETITSKSYHVVNCYRRSATTLSGSPTGGSYDFDTKTLTAPSSTFNTVPSGTDPVYVSSATASVDGAAGIDSGLTWSTWVLLVKNGENGLNAAVNLASAELWETGYYASPAPLGGDFLPTGDITENNKTWWKDPFGKPAMVWAARSIANNIDMDGGWTKVTTGLSDQKSYMSVVYFRLTSLDARGRFYHRAGELIDSDGLTTTFPTFTYIDVDQLEPYKWYVSVGFIFANSALLDSSTKYTEGGLYKVSTSEKIQDAPNFKMRSGVTEDSHKAFLYAANSLNGTNLTPEMDVVLHVSSPMFYEINGNEPNFNTLIGKAGPQGDSITITSATTDGNGDSVVTFSDGSIVTVGKGVDGVANGVIPIYATSTTGTDASFIQGTREFVNFKEWSVSVPSIIPSGLTYVRFKGEIGPDGIASGVLPVYATSTGGDNASFTQGVKEYVNFYEWTETKPVTPPSGLTYLKIVGNSITVTATTIDGNGDSVVTFSDGSSITITKGTDGTAKGVKPIYATDTGGTDASFSQGAREFVNFYEWTGAAPSAVPSGLTYGRFTGEVGQDGVASGVLPVYATDESGTSASLVQGSREYVNFYEWTEIKPTSAPSGLAYLKIVGENGADTFAAFDTPTAPAQIGGKSNINIYLNYVNNGQTYNQGELSFSDYKLVTPSGLIREESTGEIFTSYGEGFDGVFYLMHSEQKLNDRFPSLGGSQGNNNIIPIQSDGTNWFVFRNDGGTEQVTLLGTDTIIAAVGATTTTGGLDQLYMYTSGMDGPQGPPGVDSPDAVFERVAGVINWDGTTDTILYEIPTLPSGNTYNVVADFRGSAFASELVGGEPHPMDTSIRIWIEKDGVEVASTVYQDPTTGYERPNSFIYSKEIASTTTGAFKVWARLAADGTYEDLSAGGAGYLQIVKI